MRKLFVLAGMLIGMAGTMMAQEDLDAKYATD